MGITRLIGTSALIILMTACASGPAHTTRAHQTAPAPTAVVSIASEVPLLYVVDGVTQPIDRVPMVQPDQVASVRVIKGRTALLKYGPDASYGVVIITTKRVASHRT